MDMTKICARVCVHIYTYINVHVRLMVVQSVIIYTCCRLCGIPIISGESM